MTIIAIIMGSIYFNINFFTYFEISRTEARGQFIYIFEGAVTIYLP